MNIGDKVRVKRKDEIDFNKEDGLYHLTYENVRDKLGCRQYIVYSSYNCYGIQKIKLTDLKGNNISGDGFRRSFFKNVERNETAKNKRVK